MASKMNSLDSQANMIIEGFICPECQQDMSSIELLQAHFEMMHLKKSHSNNGSLASYSSTSSFNPEISAESTRSTLSSVIAKAKTLISSSFDTPVNPFLDSESDTNTSSDSNQNTMPNSPIAPNYVTNLVLKQYFNMNQSSGYFESHTDFFKKTRDHTVGRYVVQTNKLLITLDKLISIDLDMYSDESKRDLHYKSIVSWIQDIDVKLCPNCAKTFNLINRKHHCRLCGAIMCNKCSTFLSFALAKLLTDPDLFVKTFTDQDSEKHCEFKLRRSESLNSVNSYFFKTNHSIQNLSNANNEQHSLKKKPDLNQIFLRLCVNCSNLLEKKYKTLKDKLIRPTFVNLYEELITCINESKRMYSIYTKMAKSLNSGEAEYQLKSAEEMRLKLVKLYQQIELKSAQILQYEPTSQNKDQLKLQRNIRFQAINYLKDHSFTLSQLPNSEVYFKLKSQRELSLQEELKRLELEQMKQKNELNRRINNKKLQQQQHKQSNKPNITIDNSNGWMPTNIKASLFLDDSDSESQEDTLDLNEPNSDDLDAKSLSSQKRVKTEKEKAIRIQIQLVEKYLDEALKQKKFDEADSLRKNLNELLNSLVDK